MNIKKYYKFRILLSVMIAFITPLSFPFLITFTNSPALANFLIFSFIGLVLIFVNYNLLTLHFDRFKKSKDILLFFVTTSIIFTIIILINHVYIGGFLPTVDSVLVSQYPLFIPFALLTFSFSYSVSYSLVYKLITDKFKINNYEVRTIIISSILFGLMLALFFPTASNLLLATFSYIPFFQTFTLYFLLTLIVSYCYNQTGNLAVGMLSLGSILFIYNLLLI